MAIVKKAVRYPNTAAAADRRDPAWVSAYAYVQVRQRRRVLPERRARLRPALRACARQPLAGRDGRRDAARPKSASSAGPASSRSTRAPARRAAAARNIPEDVVGVIQYEFIDWRQRKSAHEILDELREVMAGIPGVDVEVRVPDAGPPTGKAIQVRLSAVDPDRPQRDGPQGRRAAAAKVPGVIDLTDGLPPPGRRLGAARSTAPRPRSTASARSPSAPWCSWSPPA